MTRLGPPWFEPELALPIFSKISHTFLIGPSLIAAPVCYLLTFMSQIRQFELDILSINEL